MKTLLAFILMPLGVLADQALTFASLTTVKGVTYQAVKVSKFDAVEVRFMHEHGIATVPLADLPEDLQKVFGYDPVSASFVSIVKQDERRRAIIEEADRKAKTAALIEKQKQESTAISKIESEATRIWLSVVKADEGGMWCDAQGVRIVEMDRAHTGRGGPATKRTMSGEYEKGEQYFSLNKEDSTYAYVRVFVYGLGPENMGKQMVMPLYECAWGKGGVALGYATTANAAYRVRFGKNP